MLCFQKYKQISAQLDLPTVCRQFSAVRFYRGIVDLALTSAETRDPQGFAVHFYDNGEPSEDTQGMCAYRLRYDQLVNIFMEISQNIYCSKIC